MPSKLVEENVWDYPRPPALKPDSRHVRVEFAGEVIADSNRTLRILETSHPPTFYIPPDDIRMDLLEAVPDYETFCEWKGVAQYWSIRVAELQVSPKAAWSYASPRKTYAALKDHLCFYPSRVTACYVGDAQVQAQEGDFYGGWITPEIKGPFKGGAGTWGW